VEFSSTPRIIKIIIFWHYSRITQSDITPFIKFQADKIMMVALRWRNVDLAFTRHSSALTESRPQSNHTFVIFRSESSLMLRSSCRSLFEYLYTNIIPCIGSGLLRSQSTSHSSHHVGRSTTQGGRLYYLEHPVLALSSSCSGSLRFCSSRSRFGTEIPFWHFEIPF
jgi:hypothetical protein